MEYDGGGYCAAAASQNGSYWLLSIWSAGSAGYQGNVPDNPSMARSGRAMAKAPLVWLELSEPWFHSLTTHPFPLLRGYSLMDRWSLKNCCGFRLHLFEENLGVCICACICIWTVLTMTIHLYGRARGGGLTLAGSTDPNTSPRGSGYSQAKGQQFF